MPYNEVNAMRKAGQLDEALALAERVYAQRPCRHTASALFWCLNDDSKRLLGDEARAVVMRMRELMETHDPTNEMMHKVLAIAEHMLTPEAQAEKQGWAIYHDLRQIDVINIDLRKARVYQYLKLNLPRPSLLHSLFMSEVLKMEKVTRNQVDFNQFMELWGFDAFRAEDWEPRTNKEGLRLPSTVERAISSCIREMHEDGIMPRDGFIRLLDQAIEHFPKNNHLPRYAAQILVKQGRTAEAIEAYKQLIMSLPDKFYLWSDLSELVVNPDLQMGLICGAITTGVHDEFLVNIRLQLADLLCNRQLYGHALTELNRYERAYQYKGWPLKHRYYNVLKRLPKDTEPIDNRMIYDEYKAIADDFIYAELPKKLVVKSWEKKDTFGSKSVISWQLRHGEEVIWFKPHTFHLDFRTPNGALFEIREFDGAVVWMRPAQMPADVPWLKHVQGPLKIKRPAAGKLFGFVEDVFVPAPLLYEREEGMQATALAILNEGKGWVALSLTESKD